MNLFTVNQVNQVYVADTLVTTANPAAAGEIKIGQMDGKCYIKHFSKGGGLTRSDIIENVLWAKATPASEMATTLKKATITLATGAYDSTNSLMIPGQDYILRLMFNNYIGISPEDSTYMKYGVVHTLENMSTSNFYKEMAMSIVKNMARESVKLVKVELQTSGNAVEVTMGSTTTSLANTSATGIILSEVEPDWILGLKQQKVVKLEAVPTEISILNSNGTYDEITWGNVAYSTAGTIKNGKLAADYEYFFHGERGDQYRMVGWPDYVPTVYDVDPTKEYDFIQIHYAYIGPNEGCQKSEKDITILVPRANGDTDGELGNAASTIATALDNVLKTRIIPRLGDSTEGGNNH